MDAQTVEMMQKCEAATGLAKPFCEGGAGHVFYCPCGFCDSHAYFGKGFEFKKKWA